MQKLAPKRFSSFYFALVYTVLICCFYCSFNATTCVNFKVVYLNALHCSNTAQKRNFNALLATKQECLRKVTDPS